MHNIEPELKNKIIRQHIQDGRTFVSLSDEYGIPAGTISNWTKTYRKRAAANFAEAKALSDMEELNRLKKENDELKKEVDFLKKAAVFFAKEDK